MLYPLKFKPLYKDYIWGGRNLEKLGKVLPEGRIAESWEVSCHPEGKSIISNGIFENYSLSEFIRIKDKYAIGESIYDGKNMKFPLLLKLIDAKDKLSVQVHPDNDYAKVNENGESGKHEAWYIIDAKPDAGIIHNVIPGTDKESFMEAIRKNKIESCLNYVNVFAGDVIDIYPGTVHSIGEGIVLAEIQQNSNITYRLYDYERKDRKGNRRPLNVKKALDVMDFSGKNRKGKSTGIKMQINSGVHKTFKLANKNFSIEIYDAAGETEEDADGSKFCIYLFINGKAIVDYLKGTVQIKAGESIFIPASMGKYIVKGSFKALKTYVPELQSDIVSPLIKAGYSMKEIHENVIG